MDAKQWEKGFEQKPERTFARLAVYIFLGVVALAFAGWAVHTAVYPVAQAGRVMEKTLDADNVIENYEWFTTKYNDIKAVNVQIVEAQQRVDAFAKTMAGTPRENWTRDDRATATQHDNVLDGLKQARASMIAEYNARSLMGNRQIFKDKSLPYQLSLSGQEVPQ